MSASPFGRGVGRICAVAAARTAADMAEQVRTGLRETPTIELRLDWLASDRERERMLAWVAKRYGTRCARAGRRGSAAKRAGQPVFIATCRRVAGGGKFCGSVHEEMRWLARAREAGCQWCDVEVESWRKLTPSGPGRAAAVEEDGHGSPVPLQRRGLGRVMVSVHNFQRTPENVRGPVSVRESSTDAVKFATLARKIADVWFLLAFAHGSRGASPRVVVPMGEVGLPGRILALREGSALAYAPIAEATAPGQISLQDLKYLYRAHTLNRGTRVYGVIGDPVGHSLSPLLHNTGFVERNINAVYVPFLIRPRDLRDFVKASRELGVKGFSVTIPHKTSILRHLDDCDELAASIGAVNTVTVRGDGSLYGCNTDYVGVLRALQKRFRIAGSRVLIYGAGGAARAAAFALARAGAEVAICARRMEAARLLARAVGADAVPRSALRTKAFDATVNATPVGMHPDDEISPLEACELHCRIAMDLIYRPEETKFLKTAASKGIETVSGVEMFVAQGVAQWEMWMGQRAPEPAMRRAVTGALRAEAQQRRPR